MKIVYSYYVLDVVHRGHLKQMENCKALAGKDGVSVVGILTDEAAMEKKPKPIMPFDERVEVARAIRFNDLVVPQKTYSPIQNIRSLRPDIVVESESHKKEDVEEVKRIVEEECKGRLIISPYYPKQSSTKIKNDIIKKVKECGYG